MTTVKLRISVLSLNCDSKGPISDIEALAQLSLDIGKKTLPQPDQVPCVEESPGINELNVLSWSREGGFYLHIVTVPVEIVTLVDFTWWRHQMETFTASLTVSGNQRSPVESHHKGQWRGALMFSLTCVWTNVWANSRDAGDLRRHRTHCDITVMITAIPPTGTEHCSSDLTKLNIFGYDLNRIW